MQNLPGRLTDDQRRLIEGNMALAYLILKNLLKSNACFHSIDSMERESAVNDGLVRAAQKWDAGKGAYGSCLYQWIRHYLQKSLRRILANYAVPVNGHDSLVDRKTKTAIEELIASDEPGKGHGSLVAALAKLKIRHRHALVRHVCDEVSLSELGREMGISGESVRRLIVRAKAKVRQYYQSQNLPNGDATCGTNR